MKEFSHMSEEKMSDVPQVRIFDLDKLTMYAPTPGVEGQRAKLAWGIRMGYPRLTVFTNDPADKENQGGIIRAPMDPKTFMAFLDLMRGIIRSSDEAKPRKIDMFTAKYENDRPTREKELVSELWYGRNADGIIWISVVAPNRPKIVFHFTVSEYHAFYKPSGEAFTPAEASSLAASAAIALLDRLMGSLFESDIHDPKPERKGRPNMRRGQSAPGTGTELTMGGGDSTFDTILF